MRGIFLQLHSFRRGYRGFDQVSGEDVEAEGEIVRHLLLPLLDETARRDDQAALKIAADQQLLKSAVPP